MYILLSESYPRTEIYTWRDVIMVEQDRVDCVEESEILQQSPPVMS